MIWTTWDRVLVGLALALALSLCAHRSYQHIVLDRQADQVWRNVQSVVDAVQTFQSHTGRWFPPQGATSGQARIFANPFDANAVSYQGLDEARLSREQNSGLVIQLVRYQPGHDAVMTRHVFDRPFAEGEPYLRLLLDYGSQGQTETSLLLRMQERMPPGTLAEIDDHLFVIDLRRLTLGD